MAVLVTAIHAATLQPRCRMMRGVTAWMAVTSTAMTRGSEWIKVYREIAKPGSVSDNHANVASWIPSASRWAWVLRT